MSIPVSWCLIAKAASGDEMAYARLLGAMKVNVAHGAFTSVPCTHDPKCEAADEAVTKLDARIQKDIQAGNLDDQLYEESPDEDVPPASWSM